MYSLQGEEVVFTFGVNSWKLCSYTEWLLAIALEIISKPCGCVGQSVSPNQPLMMAVGDTIKPSMTRP